ncbi:MAG: site-2 protease family protein [Candidatus Micrarchaeaceae archaeon]
MQTIRENSFIKHEIKDILMADAVLILAFSMDFAVHEPGNYLFNLLYFLPISALAVSLSFILHELMHKFVAQHYGAIAGFKTSMTGLLITLATGAFGFLLGIPGATMIYTNYFSKKQNGIVSLAGPLTNFVVFGAFLAVDLIFGSSLGPYLQSAIGFTFFISIFLAFFNMLPIYPLDGSKVLAWNKEVYIATMGVIFVLMVGFAGISLLEIVYLVIIAMFFSLFFRAGRMF